MKHPSLGSTVKRPAARRFCLVLVTAPDLDVARRLARAALEARLIACANLVPRIESHYWWRSKIERADEVLMILKTRRAHWRRLAALVKAQHPYQTPEVLAVPLAAGCEAYLKWLESETTPRHLPAVSSALRAAPRASS